MSEKSSDFESDEKLHAHWDKVVSAAYLRMIGATQEAAAAAVGRSGRTIRSWESEEELWTHARAEARSRWLTDAEDAARSAVLKSMQLGNADLGKWLLERVEPALAPPKQRHELGGQGGQPIEVVVTRRIVRVDGTG